MSVAELRQAHRYAAGDGYIALWELPRIKRAALLHDNTVDKAEKAYMKDVIKHGFHADPGVLGTFQRLAFFGETTIAAQMADLRERKNKERWFNDEYLRHAEPVLMSSTDSVGERMEALYGIARETHMFKSDIEKWGRRILLDSSDPLPARMAAAREWRSRTNAFQSDYKALAMSLIRTAYDRPEDRVLAVEELDREVHLWTSEEDELFRWIERDDQSLEG